jgi:predicted DsbA family dithiol-disulfide isomerase
LLVVKPLIKIEIVSDVVCPWCYIGKRRLERAIHSLSGEIDFEIIYLPFELNPSLPEAGVDQKEYLVQKFGGEDRYRQITRHVTKVAAEEGLTFNFDKQKIAPNTREAHRLLWFARQFNRQPQLKEALMKAYFEDGTDLSKKENLISLALSCGLESRRTTAFLNSNEGMKEVIELGNQNYARGISGVPYYIINDRYGISGAQASQTFANALCQISQEVTQGHL